MTMGAFFNWYCGNPIDTAPFNESNPPIQQDNESSISTETCIVNSLSTLPHILFIFVAAILLIYLTCTTRSCSRIYLRKFHCHTFRWIALTIFIFICAFSIFEGVLTDVTYRDVSPSKPQLYIPAIFAFLAAIVSLVYYHHSEIWQMPRLVIVSLIYWCLALLVELLKLWNLHRGEEDNIQLTFRYEVGLMSSIVYLIMILLEFRLLFSKSPFAGDVHSEAPSMRYYENYVNPISYGLFYWINWLLKLGYDHPLEMKDLGSLPENHTTKRNYQKLRKVFKQEMEQAAVNDRDPSLWKVYMKAFPHEILRTLLSKLIPDVVIYVLPLTLDAMTSYAEKLERGEVSEVTPHYLTAREFVTNAYVLASLFSLAVFVQFFILQVQFYECAVLGVHLRSGIQALVYEKSIQFSNLAGGPLTVGAITNHMSTDAMNLLDFAQTLHLTWSIPIRLAVVLILLYLYVGMSAFLGLLSVFLLLPLQAFVVQQSSKHQKEALVFADDRLKQSNEMFMGIKLLKLYGWEDVFRKMIEAVRMKELKSILRFNMQFGSTVCMCFAIPITLSVVIFGSYPYITGKNLTPSVTFTSYVLINLLTDPLFELPNVLSNMVRAMVATKRLKTFFLASEIESERPVYRGEMSSSQAGTNNFTPPDEQPKTKRLSWRRRHFRGFSPGSVDKESLTVFSMDVLDKHKHQYGAFDDTQNSHGNTTQSDDIAIEVINADFAWDKEYVHPTLRDINVSIPVGKLVMIVGAVGSGKSSLLSAIIQEMTTVRGNIYFNRRNRDVAYTAQRAWMINASLRENILFGAPFNEQRYRQVIDACALKVDIDILPAGDLTEIGEKGINLSGGQKQRVSVARAIYSNKNIVLMDDPLSALDVHVGDHLFNKGIKGMLLKNKRTVVLVTHQIQHLQHADMIVVMQDGAIVQQGTFDEIVNRDPNMFAEGNLARSSEAESASDTEEHRKLLQEQRRQKRYLENNDEKTPTTDDATGDLIQDEELERGAVSYRMFFYLFKSMGHPITIAYIVCRLLQEGCNVYRIFWLAFWSGSAVTVNPTESTNNVYYIVIYCGISLIVIITTALMAYTAVVALYFGSRNIHQALLMSIFKSPMRFFDTTPAGRVLNRLSSDTQVIDTKLLVSYISVTYYMIALPASLIAMSVITPILLVEVLPLAVIYFVLEKYFIRSSRELQRLDSTSRSPVFAHFSETLGGLSTIRAYGEEERFFNILLNKIDTNNATYLYLRAAYSWIGSQLNFMSFAIVIMVSFTTIYTAETSGLRSSYVGLTLSYAVGITYLLYSLLKLIAETEIQMNAVERISHYTNLVNEDPTGQEPPSKWPHRGEIQIEDLHVRYAQNLPPVLNSVYLHIRPGEKVGICGRTGSGKSSLTLSLFRLIDTYQGRILIDGLDIASLPLSTLRSRLSIIPQDPVLFTGTIRNNLDPEGTMEDAALWNALQTAQLKTVVVELGAGLDYKVCEGGENFSVGQRQLFCLARAFLRNSRILIMDEATASIDYETEKVLQEVVSSAFREKTVITIAHRVSTIMSSDTIVVLSKGQIAEHDTPQNLLARESSMFASLVQANK